MTTTTTMTAPTTQITIRVVSDNLVKWNIETNVQTPTVKQLLITHYIVKPPQEDCHKEPNWTTRISHSLFKLIE